MLTLAIYTSLGTTSQHYWNDDEHFLYLTNTTRHHKYKHSPRSLLSFISYLLLNQLSSHKFTMTYTQTDLVKKEQLLNRVLRSFITFYCKHTPQRTHMRIQFIHNYKLYYFNDVGYLVVLAESQRHDIIHFVSLIYNCTC